MNKIVNFPSKLDQQVKVLAVRPNELSSIPGINIVKGEN